MRVRTSSSIFQIWLSGNFQCKFSHNPTTATAPGSPSQAKYQACSIGSMYGDHVGQTFCLLLTSLRYLFIIVDENYVFNWKRAKGIIWDSIISEIHLHLLVALCELAYHDWPFTKWNCSREFRSVIGSTSVPRVLVLMLTRKSLDKL